MLFKTILVEALDRFSRYAALQENCEPSEYQYWLNRNPYFISHGVEERILLLKRLNIGGTNDVFLARNWLEKSSKKQVQQERDVVVKICKYWAEKGPNRHHRLNRILSAFQDEIRINNLLRATNIEGVVQSFGGGTAGKYPYLKMEYIKGDSLDKEFRTNLSKDEKIARYAKLGYLANTISQLHYYQVIHKDLKPKNLLLCRDDDHPNNHKILICDFGFAQAKLRESVTEYGGQMTPGYSAPEQVLMGGDALTEMVDYFSFGVILHEYITGKHLFPQALNIFMEDGFRVTERYIEHLRTGKENVLECELCPEITEWVDTLTTFDSVERKKVCPNLFDVAHRLREVVNETGYQDVNTDFLWNQLKEYGKV
ncbi:MAG: protein kinase [Fibrobacter sp.]|nr:protein kinase [Fibrobacter sp.]